MEFDLHAAATDYNGSLANPSWVPQALGKLPPLTDSCDRRPFTPACTSQSPTLDEAQLPNVLICSFELQSKVKGHANWAVASTVGELLWLNFAADGDYNFLFFPDGDRGLTKNNASSEGITEVPRQFIELEFDSRETVAHFGTPWWQNFDKIVHANRRGEAIQKELNPTDPTVAVRSVVYGLFGLDCEHDCHSEFHPVYAVAIEVGSSPTENRWAIFIRNWGNEGFCSKYDHHLQLDEGKFRLVLPRHGEKPNLDLTKTQFASSEGLIPFPEVAFDQLSGSDGQIVLTFTLPPADKRLDADMLLTLNWPQSTRTPATMRFSSQAAVPPPAAAAQPTIPMEEEAEEYLDRVLVGLQAEPSGAAAREAGMAVTRLRTNKAPEPMPSSVTIGPFTRPTPHPIAPQGRLARSLEKENQDKAFIEDLCHRLSAAKHPVPTFNGHDVSAMCSGR